MINYCSRCGAQLPFNATFCAKCGARVNDFPPAAQGFVPVNQQEELPPLKFHKFLVYLSFPLSILLNIGTLFSNIGMLTELASAYNVFLVSSAVVIILLNAVSWAGLLQKKSYIYKALPIMYGFNVFTSIICFIYSVGVFQSTQYAVSYLTAAVMTTVIAVIIIVYYNKRKMIFNR